MRSKHINNNPSKGKSQNTQKALTVATLLFFIAITSASLASAEIPEDFYGPVCVNATQCYYAVPQLDTQTTCEENAGGIFYAPGDTSFETQCAEGCCTIDEEGIDVDYEGVTTYSCEQQGGVWQESCDFTDPEPNACQDGETDCVCAGEEITSDDLTICCADEPYTEEGATEINELACPDEEPEDPDPTDPSLCGNGQLDAFETCDPTQEGDVDLDACTPGTAETPQFCTSTCECGYDPDEYDDKPGLCTPTDPDCQGDTSCQQDPGQHGVDASWVTGEAKADVTWYNIVEGCEGTLQGFSVHRGTSPDSFGDGVNLLSEARSWQAQGLEPEVTHHFLVKAIYRIEGSEIIKTATASIEPADASCIDGSATAQCLDEKTPVQCDENNQNVASECSSDHSCYTYIDSLGQHKAACQQAVDCEQCNKAYDNYGEVSGDTDVEVNIGGTTEIYSCSSLDAVEVGSSTVSYCYLDNSKGALKEYQSCSQTTSCISYRSQETCSNDPCEIRDSCSWDSQNSVCLGETVPSCDFEGADEESCDAIPECAWVNDRCESFEEIQNCRAYKTQSACLGTGSNFALNNLHDVQAESGDAEGLNKCQWTGDECIKNSDDNLYGNTNERTSSDYQSPSTTIVTDTTKPLPPNPDIHYIITDNSPITNLYADISPGSCGARTTPPRTGGANDLVLANLQLIRLSGEQYQSPGEYCLEYYAQDTGKNLEPVQQTAFTITDAQLFILDTDVDLEPNPATKTTDVTLEWTTSLEATCTAKYDETRQFTMTADWFQAIFNDLPQGNRPLEIECYSLYGTANETVPLVLDFDGRMHQPVPEDKTYNEQEITLGIHATEEASTCEYYDAGWKPLTKSEEYTTFSDFPSNVYYLYSADIEASPGYHEHRTRCTFGEVELEGGPADTIYFAIDTEAPELTITQNGSVVSDTIEVPEPETTLNITCSDPVIAGTPERPKNYESEAKEITNNGNPVAIAETKEDGTLIGQLTIQSDATPQTLRISCTDNAGNKAATRTIQAVYEDNSGPERPQFTAVNP